MKRYQIALLFFALGISVLTFFLSWLVSSRDVEIIPDVGLEYSSIKVFFSRPEAGPPMAESTARDPDTLHCDKTYPVSRAISRPTDNPKSRLGELAYVAIKELLKGPTEAEKIQGFSTAISIGTKIQKISIENGVAVADFNETLNKGVAGSCRVQAIRSQITETFKQFPEIKDVIISVNGESEEILQP